jgi:A/G-specific adenine glycosylase
MTDFALLITDWYRQNARNLPWRETNDPYFIWLSEVILQQTRVDQGKSYYLKFIETFPTVKDLAEADEQEVLKLWQGLGYYSRARNLHAAAKEILHAHHGKFPSEYASIRQLKGVGDYTAAAISSFAFGLPYAVVDGNVYRLLSRYFGESTPIDSTPGKKLFAALAQEFLPLNAAATYNQALMEMGAMVCTPKNPTCSDCPLQNSCVSLREKTVEILPVKAKKTKTRNRYFNYLVPNDVDYYLLYQRSEKDIWAKMYEPILIETETEVEHKIIAASMPEGIIGQLLEEPLACYKHILSHQTIHAKFWGINVDEIKETIGLKKVVTADLEELPIPRLFDRFLKENR